MNRRTYLGAAASAGLAGLAGCSTAVGEVAPPSVPESALEEGGWERTGQNQRTVFEESYGPATVTAKAHSLTYADAALRRSVREKTLGQIDGRLAVFSATHIDFGPNLDDLPGGIGRKQILDQTENSARSQFRDRLAAAGATDISQSGTGSLTVDTGEEASLTEYEATYPVPAFEANLPGDESVGLDLDSVAVAGELAVWKHGDYVLVAGGAYPSENVDTSQQRELSDAISVSIDIDLGLTPDAYAEEVRGLVTAVE
jgi:hypothetical protein